MLGILFNFLCQFPWPAAVKVADAYAGCVVVPALQYPDVCLLGGLSAFEAQRYLETSVIDLVLDAEADDSEGLMKDCGMKEPVVYRRVFKKYLHGFIDYLSCVRLGYGCTAPG